MKYVVLEHITGDLWRMDKDFRTFKSASNYYSKLCLWFPNRKYIILFDAFNIPKDKLFIDVLHPKDISPK